MNLKSLFVWWTDSFPFKKKTKNKPIQDYIIIMLGIIIDMIGYTTSMWTLEQKPGHECLKWQKRATSSYAQFPHFPFELRRKIVIIFDLQPDYFLNYIPTSLIHLIFSSSPQRRKLSDPCVWSLRAQTSLGLSYLVHLPRGLIFVPCASWSWGINPH